MNTITVLGALVALFIAIALIIKGIPAVYGMLLGALAGGIVGGAGLSDTISYMITGASGMTSALLRIVGAGVLAGVLIGSGAAATIAENIVKKLGDKKALISLTVATFVLTGIGVFGDVAILTVAPIGIQVAKRANLTRFTTAFAMIGGVKAGNLISPNPNTIAAAEPFNVPLTNLMLAGYIPGLIGVVATCIITRKIKERGELFSNIDETESIQERPGLFASIIGPLTAIGLLALRPIFGIVIDPLIALPVGGLVGCLAMRKGDKFIEYMLIGLNKMSGVVLLLLGTGTLAGIISNSNLTDAIINLVEKVGLPGYLLAPIAGITMGAATASATAGSSVGGNMFGEAILSMGVKPLQAAQMIYTGTLWFDSLPHGSFFHVSAGSVSMELKERLKILPYELLIGIIMTIISVLAYGVVGINF